MHKIIWRARSIDLSSLLGRVKFRVNLLSSRRTLSFQESRPYQDDSDNRASFDRVEAADVIVVGGGHTYKLFCFCFN